MNITAPVRNIPVAKPHLGTEEEAAVLEVLRSGWISQGPKVAEFEKQFAAYVGAAEAVAVSSCTAALHLALVAAGVGPGDEVICPSLSFIATANAIVHAGATPVFADIDLATYNVDPARVDEAVTPRTRAILAVHQIGLPCDLRALVEIAQRRGLILIEDAACAIGSEYEGERIGKPHGLMACFSFHPRKILTTGEGGMITTNDPTLAARLRRLRQHAMGVSDLVRHNATRVVTETYDEVGYNYRMTDLQAAVGIVQLGRLPEMLARRRALAVRYTELLSRIPWLVPPACPEGRLPNFQSYMVRLTDDAPVRRDDLMQRLLDEGISTRRAVMAIHREVPYVNGWERQLPVTERVMNSGLILPLYHAMTEPEQDLVAGAIGAWSL